jgi:hypothetical protein
MTSKCSFPSPDFLRPHDRREYERYKQDISKGTLQMQKKSEKTHIFAKICLPVMPSLLPHVL